MSCPISPEPASSPACLRIAAAAVGIGLLGMPYSSAQAGACAAEASPDWMSSVPLSRSSAPVRPADCAHVEQTPPDFSWPDHGPGSRYEFRLIHPDDAAKRRTTERNWIAWDEALPPGEYRWQVRLLPDKGEGVDSRIRRFVVEPGAIPFVVPEWTLLFARANAMPRPRALPRDRDGFLATLASERRAGLTHLLGGVNDDRRAHPQPEPAARSQGQYWAEVHEECWRTLDAAFAWVATQREEYLADALRRADNLADWDPRGPTSYANADEAAREIAWTLALVYDWLHPQLSENQRSRLLATLRVRVSDMYDDIIGQRARLAIHPYDSHGSRTLTCLAAMSVLLAGDVPEARGWLRDALPMALHWTSPWGGEDGGFGNGTAYAQWDTGGSLIAWNIVRWVTGVDLAQKAWVRNYARYIAYFLPPGTPAGVFGDGAEQPLTENWARFGKAYTSFAPSPLGRWYAAQLSGEDPARLELLLAPPPDRAPAAYPKGTPDAALFPSIGWVAMHSDLADPARASVYFKSSPYASYNHSHADQNSFVVNARGERLAIDSGYYDAYRSPHWFQWYKQTRAHNAITFDGGQGQVVFEEGGQIGRGSITRFEHQSGYDLATGNATQAYGGALTRAERSLVYLRPGLVLVYDVLASAEPRQWEWNIHALHRMEPMGDRGIRIRNGDASLCVEMLAGPATRFTQSERFSAAPHGRDLPRQWHGAFVSEQRSKTAELVALLRIDCASRSVSVSRAPCGWTAEAGGRRATFCPDRVAVELALARK